MNLRRKIKLEVESINAFDEIEQTAKAETLAWIDSGVELFRINKPDVPDKHLVSYFVLIDGEYILLVDHINAELWLPTGGHVDPGEHPRDAAMREAAEELSIAGDFLKKEPLFISSTMTVGKTAGHTDISLWYILKGNRNLKLKFDQSEFNSIKWFHKDKIPHERAIPDLSRFLKKLYG